MTRPEACSAEDVLGHGLPLLLPDALRAVPARPRSRSTGGCSTWTCTGGARTSSRRSRFPGSQGAPSARATSTSLCVVRARMELPVEHREVTAAQARLN
jgi:hypothetical protein